jgi:hypothetical protein
MGSRLPQLSDVELEIVKQLLSLRVACASMDFSAVGFSEGKGAPPDYNIFVTISSPMELLVVHAVKRRDGGLGLLLINGDVNQSITATITVDGYNFATKGPATTGESRERMRARTLQSLRSKTWGRHSRSCCRDSALRGL